MTRTALTRTALACAICVLALSAQDTAPTSRGEPSASAIADALLSNSPTVRKSGLAKARARLAEITPPLVTRLNDPSIDSVTFDSIRNLGELRSPKIAAALAGLALRPSFPWKPQAVEALADQEYAPAATVLAGALTSPVARARAAGARGLGTLRSMSHAASLRPLLDDEEGPVRIEAARALHAMGDETGLSVAVRDLTLDRKFADADHGLTVREAARKFLGEVLGDPAAAADSRPDSWEPGAVLARLRAKYPGAPIPQSITPHAADPGAGCTHAVEVRSCIDGDLHLRIRRDGLVAVGRDLVRTYSIDPKLAGSAIDALATLEPSGRARRRILGPVTCDFERFGAGSGPTAWSVVVGTGKRTAEFDAVESAVLQILEVTQGAEAVARQRRRITPFAAPQAESRSR